jgi:ribosomal protein L37AE/L43A
MGNQDLKNFITCEKCGKKLIERQKNGIWHFIFGKPNKGSAFIPVEMYIQGNVKIKCLRRACGHWNTLSYFPMVFEEKQKEQSEESESQTVSGEK